MLLRFSYRFVHRFFLVLLMFSFTHAILFSVDGTMPRSLDQICLANSDFMYETVAFLMLDGNMSLEMAGAESNIWYSRQVPALHMAVSNNMCSFRFKFDRINIRKHGPKNHVMMCVQAKEKRKGFFRSKSRKKGGPKIERTKQQCSDREESGNCSVIM